MPLSSWLFGEFTAAGTSLDFESFGLGPSPLSIPQGANYLHDHTASRSLLALLQYEIDIATGITGLVSVYVREDRHVCIDCTGAAGNISIDWTGNEDLRDALGWTANLSGSELYVAPNISPYLWCPGLTEISKGRLGQHGIPTYDTQIGGGGSFTKPVMTTSQHRVNNALTWRSVINTLAAGRVWVDGSGGEFYAFWHAVLLVGGQFTHYRALENDENSTDELTLTPANRMGPYHWAVRSGDVAFPYSRTIDNVESRSDVSIDVTRVSEL